MKNYVILATDKQFVLVSGNHLGPATNISLSLFNYFQAVTDALMWGTLSDEMSGL
jgi:hypothetical protein